MYLLKDCLFTTVPFDATKCPDISLEYYQKNARPVTDDNGGKTDIFGYVSGTPVEFNVVSIGKAYLFDVENTREKSANEALGATLLSDFQFRTIPINDDAWKYILSQTDTHFRTLSDLINGAVTKEYNEAKAKQLIKDLDNYDLWKDYGCKGTPIENLKNTLTDKLKWGFDSNWKYPIIKREITTVVPNYNYCLVGEINDPKFGTMLTRCQYPNPIAPRYNPSPYPDTTFVKGSNVLRHVYYQQDVFWSWVGANSRDNQYYPLPEWWVSDSLHCNGDSKGLDKIDWCECQYTGSGNVNGYAVRYCEECNKPNNNGISQPDDYTLFYILRDNHVMINQDHIRYSGNDLNKENFENGGQFASNRGATPCFYDFMCPERIPNLQDVFEYSKCDDTGGSCTTTYCNPANYRYTFGDKICYDPNNGAPYQDPVTSNFKHFTSDQFTSESDWYYFDIIDEDQLLNYDFLVNKMKARSKFFCNGAPFSDGYHAHDTGNWHVDDDISGFMNTMANGPIRARVDPNGWKKFVENPDSLMNKEFQVVLAPDRNYCSPHSDELAMIHLMKNYGFFEFLDEENPLKTFLGNGAADGWFEMDSMTYGSACLFPWKTEMLMNNGAPQKISSRCCIHAYVSIEECVEEVKVALVKTAPGFVRQVDPETNKTILYPFQELSCPLEVSLLDERTPDMSLAQQFESVSVSASRLVGKFSMLSIFYTTY